MSWRTGFVPALVLILTALACGDSPNGPAAEPYTYRVPSDRADGLPVAHAQSAALDVDRLVDLIDEVRAGRFINIHGVLVARSGQLVLEEYFPGRASWGEDFDFDWDILHEVHSVTKSFTSTLVGIAIDEGLIESVGEPLYRFFPEREAELRAGGKDQIRLEHLLTMTAGLDWDEWSFPYTDSRNSHVRMNESGDPLGYLLGLPLATQPGQTFNYNSGLTIAMGEVVRRASGMDTHEFARQYLFEPLNITDSFWWRYPDGTLQTGGGLVISPRSMVKFGLLFLHDGVWSGERVVSPDWVHTSILRQAPDRDYGYFWWLNDWSVGGQSVHTFSAEGRAGQFIFVAEALELVAVFTGWNDDSRWSQPRDMFQNYILPATIAAPGSGSG